MAYSPLEKSYMDSVAEYLLPQANAQLDESDMQLASSNQVMSDAPGIVPIPQTGFEKVMEKTGLTLEQIGSELDKIGKLNIGGIEIGIRDLLPFVGSMEDGKLTGTPAALQAAGRGESLITGTGFTTQLKPDAKLMALDVATAGVAKPMFQAGKAAVKGVAKALPKDLPVGMSIKGVDESLDPLGFYSAASKAVDNIAQEKGTGAQFLAQIEKTPGVKKEELLWTGLDDYLKGKKSVTKAEVQDFLNNNRVEIKEVTLDEGGRPYRYVTANEWQGAIDDAERLGNFDEAERINRAWEDFEDGRSLGGAKFSKYTMPGGENYREVLLTLPTNKAMADNVDDAFNMWMADAKAGKRGQYTAEELASITKDDVLDILKEDYLTPSTKGEFRSQHFDQPNILAHMRLNDRVDADGKKVLFVEEVQSDWHQAGRKQGYEPENALKQKQELKAIQTERFKLQEEKMKLEELADPYVAQGQDAPAEIVDKWSAISNRINQLQSAEDRLGRSAQKGVPDAPFKTSWHELALKRAIQLASEGGYDRIAFTTGKTQAERYDLSKQIDTIDYQKLDDGRYKVVAGKGGRPLMIEALTEDKLSDFVGKDIADKIIKGEGKKYPEGSVSQDMTMLSGVDLQVGGEGMKGFYDTILPKYLDKYGKKWDAKVGMTEIPTSNVNLDNKIIFEDGKYLVDAGDGLNYNSYDTKAEAIKSLGGDNPSVHYMDITPKMKESVLTKGQPLFQMAPAIPAGVAAGQQEENK